MVVKVYISGISGNKEVKKRQQRVMMILESKHIDYIAIDITEPGNESEKELMQQKSNPKDGKYPLPPQMFNEQEYCGDYDEFDLANEIDELEKFLKTAPSVSKAAITLNTNEEKAAGDASKTLIENGQVNGNTSSRENSADKESVVLEERREQDEETTEENAEAPDEEAENEQ